MASFSSKSMGNSTPSRICTSNLPSASNRSNSEQIDTPSLSEWHWWRPSHTNDIGSRSFHSRVSKVPGGSRIEIAAGRLIIYTIALTDFSACTSPALKIVTISALHKIQTYVLELGASVVLSNEVKSSKKMGSSSVKKNRSYLMVYCKTRLLLSNSNDNSR